MQGKLRIGVDVCGFFTDLAPIDHVTGATSIHTQLTTSQAVPAGPETLPARAGVAVGEVRAPFPRRHAGDQRRDRAAQPGAKTGMPVTRGFPDALDIAMERRCGLFDPAVTFAGPVASRGPRLEVEERIRCDGAVGDCA